MAAEHQIHLIGNAHLDPVWLWRWQEGYAEVKATFRSALDRMKEFPEFIFTCSSMAYYQWVEENAPEMFEEIRERVREGRWAVVGGWYIQPDCNIPSGESFARHGLYSQRYFREKFGTMARTGYCVDSFGHSGMLPQILRKSGMEQYVFMRPGPDEKELPGNLFLWESPDGSRVTAFRIPYEYSIWWGDINNPDPVEKQKLVATRALAKELGYDQMGFYGVGNHGGGPTIENLRMMRELKKEWGDDILVMSSPDRYFDAVKDKGPSLSVVRDDLQHHAVGVYSAHSEIKSLNRRAEHRLFSAEAFSVMAHRLLGLSYPAAEIRRAWECVMFNQFHDIVTGCSIREAYQDARESYGCALDIAARAQNGALQKISWSIDTSGGRDVALTKEKDVVLWEVEGIGAPLVVFNPHPWEVRSPVQVNKKLKGITDKSGRPLPLQIVRGTQTNIDDKWDTLFTAEVPPMGYRMYRIYREREFPQGDLPGMLNAGDTFLENGFVRLELDASTGYIKRLYDKKSGIDALSGPGAVPVVIDETEADTWAHLMTSFIKEAGRFTGATVRLLETGPLRTRLRVTSTYNMSILRQDFFLYHDRPDIEVAVKLDWREPHCMLKLSFPVNVENPKTFCEIPYGFIERATSGIEVPGQRWMDVSGDAPGKKGQTRGLALLNDAKYGFSVNGNDLRLTVVRSPIYADHFGLRDEYCEVMDQGIQEFRYALVPHNGSWTDAEVVRKAVEFNVLPEYIVETYHRGPLPPVFEGLHIESDAIVVSAFKLAEDGDAYILRCYETRGTEVYTMIRIPLLNRTWEGHFDPCEIKTLRIPIDPGKTIGENDLLEMQWPRP